MSKSINCCFYSCLKNIVCQNRASPPSQSTNDIAGSLSFGHEALLQASAGVPTRPDQATSAPSPMSEYLLLPPSKESSGASFSPVSPMFSPSLSLTVPSGLNPFPSCPPMYNTVPCTSSSSRAGSSAYKPDDFQKFTDFRAHLRSLSGDDSLGLLHNPAQASFPGYPASISRSSPDIRNPLLEVQNEDYQLSPADLESFHAYAAYPPSTFAKNEISQFI